MAAAETEALDAVNPLTFGRDVADLDDRFDVLSPSKETRCLLFGVNFNARTLMHFVHAAMFDYPGANAATVRLRQAILQEKNPWFARYMALGVPDYRRKQGEGGRRFAPHLYKIVTKRAALLAAGAAPRQDCRREVLAGQLPILWRLGVMVKIASCAETRQTLLDHTGSRPLRAFLGPHENVMGCGDDGHGNNYLGRYFVELRAMYRDAHAAAATDGESNDQVDARLAAAAREDLMAFFYRGQVVEPATEAEAAAPADAAATPENVAATGNAAADADDASSADGSPPAGEAADPGDL